MVLPHGTTRVPPKLQSPHPPPPGLVTLSQQENRPSCWRHKRPLCPLGTMLLSRPGQLLISKHPHPGCLGWPSPRKGLVWELSSVLRQLIRGPMDSPPYPPSTQLQRHLRVILHVAETLPAGPSPVPGQVVTPHTSFMTALVWEGEGVLRGQPLPAARSPCDMGPALLLQTKSQLSCSKRRDCGPARPGTAAATQWTAQGRQQGPTMFQSPKAEHMTQVSA